MLIGDFDEYLEDIKGDSNLLIVLTFTPLILEAQNEPDDIPVDICSEELEKLLLITVKNTENFSLQLLVDLYGQMNTVIKKYSKSHERRQLPKVIILWDEIILKQYC